MVEALQLHGVGLVLAHPDPHHRGLLLPRSRLQIVRAPFVFPHSTAEANPISFFSVRRTYFPDADHIIQEVHAIDKKKKKPKKPKRTFFKRVRATGTSKRTSSLPCTCVWWCVCDAAFACVRVRVRWTKGTHSFSFGLDTGFAFSQAPGARDLLYALGLAPLPKDKHAADSDDDTDKKGKEVNDKKAAKKHDSKKAKNKKNKSASTSSSSADEAPADYRRDSHLLDEPLSESETNDSVSLYGSKH